MCLASGVTSFQLFLVVQITSFATWYFKLVCLNHYFNVLSQLWTHWFVVQTVLSFTALCYSSPYFPTAANEQEVSHIDRKRLTSALKNKVDRPASSHACSHVVLPKHYNNLCHSACVSTHINQHFLYLSWFWWIMGIIFNIWSWHLSLVWDKTQIQFLFL